MTRYNAENERVKREYVNHLRLAQGKQETTIDGALKAIDRFERSTGYRPFKSFHIEQAKAFRAKFGGQPNSAQRSDLSAATITSTLRSLKAFFIWLAERPGYRSRIRFADAEYFTPNRAQSRIATARREARVPTLEQFEIVLRKMPIESVVDCRDRAVLAFLVLSGARDGSIPTFKLRHIDLTAGVVSHDARDVKTKGAKTFPSVFFPVCEFFREIFSEYVGRLTAELHFGPDDPLFPAPEMGLDAKGGFAVLGLSRRHWSDASPIRRIVRNAFESAGFDYPNPHKVRKTLALLGERKARTPEEWKAWSQNFGHENEMTTFRGYGEVPFHRQLEIMTTIGRTTGTTDLREQIAKLEQIAYDLRGAAR